MTSELSAAISASALEALKIYLGTATYINLLEGRPTSRMQSKPSPFRVLIAGGSIAGLTLAYSLQHAGIDYLMLEARRELAPQLGASTGLGFHCYLVDLNTFDILDFVNYYTNISNAKRWEKAGDAK